MLPSLEACMEHRIFGCNFIPCPNEDEVKHHQKANLSVHCIFSGIFFHFLAFFLQPSLAYWSYFWTNSGWVFTLKPCKFMNLGPFAPLSKHFQCLQQNKGHRCLNICSTPQNTDFHSTPWASVHVETSVRYSGENHSYCRINPPISTGLQNIAFSEHLKGLLAESEQQITIRIASIAGRLRLLVHIKYKGQYLWSMTSCS